MASKHDHIQALEVNAMVLSSFLGSLDFPCVCCIHTTVRITEIQHIIPESQVGQGGLLTHKVSWRPQLCLSHRPCETKASSYVPCPSSKPGAYWLVPHLGTCVTVLTVVERLPSQLLTALLGVRFSSSHPKDIQLLSPLSPLCQSKHSDSPVLTV